MRVAVLVGVRMGVHEVAVPVRMRVHVRMDVCMFMLMLVRVLLFGCLVLMWVIVRQAFAIRHGDPPGG
jgi:hypothetical protein